LKHKEAWALKERVELATIVGGVLQKSAYESLCARNEREQESKASKCGKRKG
jgi:hypothetical protein